MRLSSILLSSAVLLLVAAAVLLATADSGADEFGWFAYAPDGASTSTPDWFLLSTRQVIGWAVGWLGSLLLTGAVTYRLTGRRRPTV